MQKEKTTNRKNEKRKNKKRKATKFEQKLGLVKDRYLTVTSCETRTTVESRGASRRLPDTPPPLVA